MLGGTAEELPDEMREVLYRYLLERPAGAPPDELLHLVFTAPGSDPEFGPHFLRALLGSDPRFAYRSGEDRWLARVHEALTTPLDAACFTVVDIETTGGSATTGGITEIGAVRVTAGKIEAEFRQLVNPYIPVQPFVTHLTGISDEMLADQPGIEEVLPRFAAFAGDSVLVAHNAGFDIGFLNVAMRQQFGRPLHQPHLCTLRLARRLVPNLRRRSLDSLAEHFGIAVRDRHRALGDARMTAEVLFCLLDLVAQRGIGRLDEILDLQGQARDGRPFICPLPAARVNALPEVPGVYRFLGQDGRLLYVGRSNNLRQRVGSYLYNSRSHGRRTLDLIRHIHSVEVEEAGSDLEAALLEAELIRALQPPYNRLSKHLPQIAYLKLTTCGSFPRLSVARRLTSGRARFYGPFRNRRSAEGVRDVLLRVFQVRTCSGRLRPDPAAAPCFLGQIEMCTAPCAARIDADAYALQIDRLIAFFEGDTAWARETLEQRREAHSTALRFEAAARAQRDIEELDRFSRRIRTLGWVVQRQDFLILTRGAECPRAYVVLGGRLALRRSVRNDSDLEEISAWVRAEWERFHSSSIQRDEVEAATILAGWLRRREGRDGCVLALSPSRMDPHEWSAALDSLQRCGDEVRAAEEPTEC